MDSYDKKIIELLMGNARVTWSELASQIGLSAPAAAERVNRLVEQKIILEYRAIIDSQSLGYECTAFVAVTLEKPSHRTKFLQKVQEVQEIQECHHIAGDDDYLLKVRCKNIKDLDRVISEELKSLSGVVKTKTTIVMDTLKETSVIPLD